MNDLLKSANSPGTMASMNDIEESKINPTESLSESEALQKELQEINRGIYEKRNELRLEYGRNEKMQIINQANRFKHDPSLQKVFLESSGIEDGEIAAFLAEKNRREEEISAPFEARIQEIEEKINVLAKAEHEEKSKQAYESAKLILRDLQEKFNELDGNLSEGKQLGLSGEFLFDRHFTEQEKWLYNKLQRIILDFEIFVEGLSPGTTSAQDIRTYLGGLKEAQKYAENFARHFEKYKTVSEWLTGVVKKIP